MRLEWIPHWQRAWQRDDPYIYDDDAYCDQETGNIIWLKRCEDDAEDLESEVRSDPARYWEIPVLSHASHHNMFSQFLTTGLPVDHEAGERVRAVCNTASIGGFLKDVQYHFEDQADEIVQAWYDYHDEALRSRATTWLRERGIEPDWVN